jgi:hypothetical protein
LVGIVPVAATIIVARHADTNCEVSVLGAPAIVKRIRTRTTR